MICLPHNSRYRSLFHGVSNELRNENRIPLPVLRTMPKKCCTCKDIDQLTPISVVIDDKHTLSNLQKLNDQIDRDKKDNPKIVLALNRLENFIKENRGPIPITPLPDVVQSESSRFSESENDTPMDTGRRRIVRKQKKEKKPPKPLKNGTFLYLPYKLEEKSSSDALLEDAKRMQRGRFLGRNQYIKSLNEEHHVCINMITPKTTEQIKRTLVNAKAGVGNVKIHNQEAASEGTDGEWVLVRQEKTADETNTTDFEALFQELENRWNSFLNIRKRKNESDSEEEDANEHPNKK